MTNRGNQENIPYGRLVRICGLFAASAGVIALLGWDFGLPFLASLGSGNIPMAPSTALLFVLYGAATVLRARLPLHRGAYWLGVVLHGAGAPVALLLFCLSYQGMHLGVEHLGFPAVGAVGGAPIGHMSPVTALGFLLASLSFLASLPPVSNRRRRARMACCFAGLLLAACSALLLAYLYGTPLLYGGSFVPPAATTSLAFAALGIALVALASPQAWPSGEPDVAAATRPAPVLVLVFFLLAVGIITAGYLYFRSYAAHYRTAVARELSSVADLKAAELVQYRKERLGDGSVVFHNATVAALVRRVFDNPADDEAQAQLRVWLDSIEAHYQYARLFLLDGQGAVRMSVPESLVPIASVVARRAAEVLRSGEMAFQDFYRDEHDQRIYLTVLVPIVGGPHSGRTLGVLALLIDPEEYLYPFISRWPRSTETAEILLVRRDGNDVLFLNDIRFKKNTTLTVRVPLERLDVVAVKAILGQKEGIVDAVDYRGVAVIADIRAVPDSPWFLVSRMDVSEMNAPLRKQMWVMVVLIGALLAAAGLGVASVFGQQQAGFYRERFEAERDRAWLREVIERSLNEIYVFDPETLRFSFANTGACRNIGYTAEELARLTPLDIEPEFTEEAFRAMLQPLRTGKHETFVFETVHRRKDGPEYPVEVHLQHVDAGGGPVFLAIASDITERKHAEAELCERDERFRQLEESVDAVFWMVDAQVTKFLYVSRAVIRVWGRAAETFYGEFESFVRDIVADDRQKVIGTTSRAREGYPVELEFRITRPDGAIRWLSLRTFPIRDSAGVLYRTAGLTSDVTERRRVEEELARAKDAALESSRLKSAFLANMSHEVRTPLNVITGFADLIDEHLQEIGDHSQDELFESLRSSSKRLINTMHGLLDLSSVETGAFLVTPKRIELSSFLREQIDRFTPAARSKRLSLGLEVEESSTEVTFDPYCLTRVVENLLDNAIKFTERGGVTVRVRRDATGALCLSVCDTGIGIDPSYVPHIFERFSQEESGYTRHFEGAGIGLALVEGFVEMNQAKISFESDKNRGTTFTIRFASRPSAVEHGRAAAAVPSSNAVHGGAAQRPVVLVVENDDLTQILMAMILRQDFDVLVAASGEEVRAHLAAHSDVAIVLMDLSLRGDEDGLMLTRWMRAELRWRDVPIIATTAHAMPEDRQNTLEAGCTAYLTKPISRTELLSAIRHVLPRAADAPEPASPRQ